MSKFGITLKLYQVIILLIVITLLTTLFSIAIQPGDFYNSLIDIVTRPFTIVLNLFPILVFVLLGYFIVGNIFWGATIPSFVFLILSYINLLKIEGRNDAFVPADFVLFREGLSAVSDYGLNLHVSLLLLILLYCIILFILGFYIKSNCFRVHIRLIYIIVISALFLFSIKFVYSNKKIYDSFEVPEMYNIPSIFNTLGFNYCFLYNFNLYPVDKPKGYKKLEVEKWEKQYLKDKESPKTKPNIIMVMGEAFSDISNEEVFNWSSKEENPAYKFNLLTSSERAISGHIIVSNIMAGTANTEFDVLTGMPTIMINDNTTSAFRVVHKSIPTVASLLKSNGYSTVYMHPGDSWFYNRSSVYKYFGIENQIFIDDFDLENDVQYGLVSDDNFLEQLKKEINVNQSSQFVFGVTIQNHQAYKYFKYFDDTEPASLDIEISDNAMEYLSVYLRGVRDTSDMIYELAEYIDELDEPTILVFFGDHLPNLGENNLTYSELGLSVGNTDTVENTLSAYKTPFIIYGNVAYYESVDFENKVKSLELPKNGIINSNYLGTTVLELVGYAGYDSYFDYLNYARRNLPVFRTKENAYMLADGTYVNVINDEIQQDIIKKIDWWEYHRLKG